jgi:hypothetical protein
MSTDLEVDESRADDSLAGRIDFSARVDVAFHLLTSNNPQLDPVTTNRIFADANVLDRAVDVVESDSRPRNSELSCKMKRLNQLLKLMFTISSSERI